MQRPAESIPEGRFYRTDRPAPEPGFLQRAAGAPLRFGLVLFLVGWAGILAQRSFLHQVVVGAPVFEELAKLGLALLVVAPLGARSMLARLPYAWLSGLAFGVVEHFLTYGDEPVLFYLLRVAFHTATTGLSMAAFTLLEPHADVRLRWASSVPATLLHWGNNFGAVAIAVLASGVPVAEAVGTAWSGLVTAGALVLTLGLPRSAEAFRARAAGILGRLLPGGLVSEAPGPRASLPEVEGPRSSVEPEPLPEPSPPSEPEPQERS